MVGPTKQPKGCLHSVNVFLTYKYHEVSNEELLTGPTGVLQPLLASDVARDWAKPVIFD